MSTVGRKVKTAVVEELSTLLSQRPNVFITHVSRMKALDADALRQSLRDVQASLVRIQKTLGRRVFSTLKLDEASALLEGSVGLILSSDDVVVTAKRLFEFRKGHEEQLTIRGAIIEGQILDLHRVEELANLPAKPVLLAQVLCTIESPMADVIFTLERLIGDVAWSIEQISAKVLTDSSGDSVKKGAATPPEESSQSPSQEETQAPPTSTT